MTDKDKAEKLSIKEFKMWLQGVEEMQADDWTPDHRQWQRIRAKINQIDETSAPVRAAENVTLPPDMSTVFRPMDTSPPASMPRSSSLNVPPPPPAAAPRAASTPAGLPVTLATDPNRTVKTPDRDTSSGKYSSEFA